MAFASAMPGYATQSYICSFTKECIAGSPCELRDDLTAELRHDAQAWVMTVPDGTIATFSELTGAPKGTLRLISRDIDTDAAAIALLGVSQTGRAILSVQGYFPGLGAVTQLGKCLPEGE